MVDPLTDRVKYPVKAINVLKVRLFTRLLKVCEEKKIQEICTPNSRLQNSHTYFHKNQNILQAHGKSAHESQLLYGYALNMGKAAQGMPNAVKNAKIACLDFDLRKSKMQMGVQVLVSDPRELERIRERESDITKERIHKVRNMCFCVGCDHF